ncbi:hypothetical protein M8818_006039 [Zalaria obscura]|uniref:Uncharacterized protein n=1 Tax=Zalaria obscura TaxID=2024903 RepID=A0ACC3S7S8_9PEZI
MRFTLAPIAGFVATAFATVDTTQPCSQQPAGYGPVPSPNTDVAFAQYAPFAATANAAVAPALYQRTFVNLNGSVAADSSNVYMGFYELQSYNAASCTALCDKTSGCVGTNLYYERDPSLNPAAACPNPAAITVIKCALWGSPVTAAQATNQGQYRANFHVVIAGSNGNMKLPAQACSAISQAWNGASWTFPTGYVNWNNWMSMMPTSTKAATTSTPAAYPSGGAYGGWSW